MNKNYKRRKNMKKLSMLWMGCALLCMPVQVAAQFWGNSERIVASKTIVNREVQVGTFDKICLTGSGDIEFTQAEGRRQVNLEISDNLEKVVEVKVKDGTLFFALKKGYSVSMSDGARMKLYVSAPMVESAVVNGSGDIVFRNGVSRRGGISLTVNGSGDIDAGTLTCDELNAAVNGSGDIEVNRAVAGNVNVAVNGSGDVKMDNASADELSAAVNGSGDVEVRNIAADRVNGAVQGSGDVVLSGKCTEGHYSLTGSGDISAASLKAKRVWATAWNSGDISCYASDELYVNKRSRSSNIHCKGNPKKIHTASGSR